MTVPVKTAGSFALILLLGLGIFTWQSRRLGEVRAGVRTAERSNPTADRTTAATPRDDTRNERPPVKKSILERLSGKLFATIEISKIVPIISSADKLSRIILAAKLGKVEQDEFKRAFDQFDAERAVAYLNQDLTGEQRADALNAISGRQDAWITGHLDSARAASLQSSEESFKRAGAEQNATRAVSRIVNSVSLTDEQKDRLYAGFLDRELHPPAAPVAPLKVQIYGNISLDPPAPAIHQDAQKILTPEQWRTYQDVSGNKSQIASYQQMLVLHQMYPVLISKLQEVLDEEEDSGTTE